MNIALLAKAVPAAVVGIYVLFTKPGFSKKREPAATRQVIEKITGQVQKHLSDSFYNYFNVTSGSESHWIASQLPQPAIGVYVECIIERSMEAYESNALPLAFEKMHFAREIHIS